MTGLTPEEISESAEGAQQVAHTQPEYEPLPQDDPMQRQPDITLAKKILNWEPKVNLQDGLAKTIDFFRTIV